MDREHNLYNVEIQQKREGASPKRARYHSGLLDMNLLEPREAYQKLPNSYVIFITETDALGYHLPIYHISRKIQEKKMGQNLEMKPTLFMWIPKIRRIPRWDG